MAILAAAQGAPVAAVVADSTPDGLVRVAIDRSSLPSFLFTWTQPLFGHFSKHGSLLDLQDIVDKKDRPDTLPTLIIQGSADTTVDPSNAGRLAKLTGGAQWLLPGVGHTDASETNFAEYVKRLTKIFP